MSTDDGAETLDALLTTPGTLPQAVSKLNEADEAFGRFDTALRHGGQAPARWKTATPASFADRERVTDLYDRLSSALRTTGQACVCLEALRKACKLWHMFDAELRAGSGMPEPWQK